MPGLVYPVPELEEAIVRPVVLQVVKALNETLGIDPKTRLLYRGDSLQIPHPKSGTSARGLYLPNLDDGGKLEVELEETYTEDNIQSQSVDTRNLKPLFEDASGNWLVRDVHALADCTLNFVYRTKDRTEADKFRSHVYTRLARGFTQTMVDCNISFPLSNQVLATMMQFWVNYNNLASKLNEPTISFTEFLDSTCKQKYSVESNLSGKHRTVVLPRTIGGIAITLESKEISKPTDPDPSGVYRVSFSVNFRYNKPINFFIRYPIFMYNSLLNVKYFDVNLDRNYVATIPTENSDTFLSLYQDRENAKRKAARGYPGIYLPGCDDWIDQMKNYKRSEMVIQWLIAVDVEDNSLIYDLNKLSEDGLEMHPDFMSYVQQYREDFFTTKFLPLFFVFFEGTTELTPSDFYIDENLCIRAKEHLNPKRNYHLQLRLQLNLDLLPDTVVEEMCNEGTFLVDICRAISTETVEDNPPEIKPDGGVWVADVNKVIESLPTLPVYPGATASAMRTVNIITVSTNHIKD